jgi:hypothetical protein
MCQKIILSILSFAHALQTPNGWTGNNFGVSSASIPSETDPLRVKFYASSTFVHFLPKGYSREGDPEAWVLGFKVLGFRVSGF